MAVGMMLWMPLILHGQQVGGGGAARRDHNRPGLHWQEVPEVLQVYLQTSPA